MQITWTKYTYVCDPDECDSLVEYTCGDTFGFPSGDVRNFTCPCGRKMNLVSVEDATIPPINERKQMETTMYNPNALVTVKKIVDGEPTYQTIKVVDLEGMLFVDPVIDVIESLPNGEHVLHNVSRRDVSEMFRIKQFREARLADNEKQLGQIIDNLTIEGWYNPNTEKEEVLRDLCEIVGHTPQQEMSWSITLTVSGTTLVNLDEVEDFDVRYHLGDNLSVDSNDFDTKVDSWDVDCVDSQDWI
jgi:hypothetical protein